MGTPGTYDVVIIGSGLGGMLSVVMLARTGMKVCVLEKNKQIGGCLQTFSHGLSAAEDYRDINIH